MRIGSRQAPAVGQQEYSRQSARPEDFGAGVGAALGQLGSSLLSFGETQVDILQLARQREERNRNAQLDIEFIRLQGEESRRNIDRRANVQPGAANHTNTTYEDLGLSFENFATRLELTPEERLRYEERFETFRQSSVTSEFAFELEESNRYLVNEIETTVDSLRAEIHTNPGIFDQRWMELETAINEADLLPTVREELLTSAYNRMAATLFESETEAALRDQLPVGETTGEDVVAAGTSAYGRALLNTYSDVLTRPALRISDISGNPPSRSELYDITALAWGQVLPPGSRIEVTSADRNRGGTSQHDIGNAIDFAVYRPDGSRVMWNDPEALQAAQIGRQLGIGGFGWGPTYMSGSHFHWDMREGLSVWSDDDGGASDGGPGAAQFRAQLEAISPGAPTADSAGQALLGTIHSVESGYGGRNPYNVLFGGETFESYADHPRQRRTDPRTGRTTTAAGRYQFLESTWDFVRGQMEAEGYDFGPEPFSPVNQDRAALWYAEHRYGIEARRLGLPPELQDLNTALASGNREAFATVRWVLSGESGGGVAWEGLQNLTNEEFYDRMQQGMSRGSVGSAARPDIWSDPRFESIPFEDRLQLESAAQNAVRAQREQIARARQEQEAAAMAQLRITAGLGDMATASAQGMTLIQNGTVTGIENIERILGWSEAQREREALSGEQQSRRATGAVAIPSDMDGLNAELATTGVATGLRERSSEAAAVLMQNALRDGMVPSQAMDILFSQLNSGDQAQQLYSAELLADLYAQNPRAATSGLSQQQIRDVALANTLARTSASPAEFMDRLNRLRSPENAQQRQALMQQAEELLAERGPDQFFRQMYSGMERFFGGAEMPALGDMPQFEQDARTLFQEFYSLTGDEQAAMEATGQVLRHSYSPSPLDGALMQYSPTAPMMNVPRVGGTHSWIPEYVEGFVQSELSGLIERQVEQAIAFGLPEADARAEIEAEFGTIYDPAQMQILADTQTLRDLQQHGVPSYTISYVDQFGQLRLLRDADNNVMRVPMAPTEEMLAAQQVETNLIHTETLLNRARLGGLEGVLGNTVNLMRNPLSGGNFVNPDFAPNLEESRTAADTRLYNSTAELPTEQLVRIRNQLTARLQSPDPYSADPFQMLVVPSLRPDEQRLLGTINRILQERAQ